MYIVLSRHRKLVEHTDTILRDPVHILINECKVIYGLEQFFQGQVLDAMGQDMKGLLLSDVEF